MSTKLSSSWLDLSEELLGTLCSCRGRMPIPRLKPGVLPLSAIGEWGWAISWRSLDFAAAASGIRFAFAQPDRAAFAGVANKCKSTRATVEARRTTAKCGRFCRQVFAWKVGGVPDSKDGDTCSSNNSSTAMHTRFWLVRTHQTVSDTKGH